MKKSKKIIILILLLVLIIFLAIVIYMNTYNWDSYVQEYLNSRLSVETKFVESYKDKVSNSIIYKYQTNDDLQIPFEVTCYWGRAMFPFGFKELAYTKIIDDNLGLQVGNYISENKGTYNIENKSIEEISTYILEVIQESKEILYQYGLEYIVPRISFTLVSDEKTYDFEYDNTNETILRDALTELLYK